MTAEQIIWRLHDPNQGRLQLVKIDVTDPTIHATHPYQLVREAYLSNLQVPLCRLRRPDLEALYEAIGRELGR